MVVICDISALQYWNTPPLFKSVGADLSGAVMRAPAETGLPSWLFARRRDAREAIRVIQGRLLNDLVGVSAPIHAMTDDSLDSHASRLLIPHRIPPWLAEEHLVYLGAGLHVLTPEATLCSLRPRRSARGLGEAARLAKMMFEAAGIFVIPPDNERTRLVVTGLAREGLLAPETYRGLGIYGFSDASGRPFGDRDEYGEIRHWVPSFDRLGAYAGMWKRPPLTSAEAMLVTLDALGAGERSARRSALSVVLDGAASPNEVRAVMMLCAPRRFGGEGWEAPSLNRQVIFSEEAAALAHAPHCFADGLWEGRKKVLEVLGEAFHADGRGFRLVSGRTAALESMGYTVAELIDEQLRRLELFDALLPSLAAKLGFGLAERTPAFLRRREALHHELFGFPFSDA